MITAPVTEAMLENWKRLFSRFASSLSPNRKTGGELDAFFRNKYEYSILNNERWESIVKASITDNECFREKLPLNAEPLIKSYSVENVMVGIDLLSGFFQVESEDTEKMILIHDDLFTYRGLDSSDLKNFVLVGQYLELTHPKWADYCSDDEKPDMNKISEYISNDLWDGFCRHLETGYDITPTIQYSICSCAPGWNVKYRKGGRALCTLYPDYGFFYCLVIVGSRESAAAELILPFLSETVRKLYQNAKPMNGARWLMIPVDTPQAMDNAEQLIALRAKK